MSSHFTIQDNSADAHGCSASAHGVMGCRIHLSWWTYKAIYRSSQCSITGVAKAVLYAILSASKRSLAANKKE